MRPSMAGYAERYLEGFRSAGGVRVGRNSCEARGRATNEALGLEEVLERDRLGMEQKFGMRRHNS